MEICSTSFVFKKIQIKAKRYHNTPVGMSRIQNSETSNADNVMEQLEFSFTASGKRSSEVTVEYSSVVSYEDNLSLNTQSSKHTSYPSLPSFCPHKTCI